MGLSPRPPLGCQGRGTPADPSARTRFSLSPPFQLLSPVPPEGGAGGHGQRPGPGVRRTPSTSLAGDIRRSWVGFGPGWADRPRHGGFLPARGCLVYAPTVAPVPGSDAVRAGPVLPPVFTAGGLSFVGDGGGDPGLGGPPSGGAVSFPQRLSSIVTPAAINPRGENDQLLLPAAAGRRSRTAAGVRRGDFYRCSRPSGGRGPGRGGPGPPCAFEMPMITAFCNSH